MTTTEFLAGRITGTRLHVSGVASAYTWQDKRPVTVTGPVFVGVKMINNSTVVSARERRPL
jgi:hypothetical protein